LQGTNFRNNHSISQGIDGFIFFREIQVVPMFVIVQIVACLRTEFGNVEAIDRLQIRKKTSREKAPPSRTLVGLNSERNKKRSEYSINQGAGGLENFQAKSNAPITLDFQLVDYMHMKSGKIDVVGRPQIERSSHKRNFPETVVRFVFCMYHELNECSIMERLLYLKLL